MKKKYTIQRLTGALFLILFLFFKDIIAFIIRRDPAEIIFYNQVEIFLKLGLLFLGLVFFFYKKFRKIFKRNKANIVLALVVVLSMLFLTEFVLDRINNFNSRTNSVNSVDFSFDYTLNSDLFKDDEFELSKKEDEQRVFFIGDSFVFGIVEEEYNFDKIFESKNSDINAFNLGLPGIGPYDYVNILKKYKKYNPDLIFVGIFVGNDIENYDSSLDKYRKISGFISKLIIPNIKSSIRAVFLRTGIIKDSGREQTIKLFDENKDRIDRKHLNDTLNSKISYHMLLKAVSYDNFIDHYDEKVDIVKNKNALKNHLIQLNKEADSRLVIVIFPSKYQISEKNWCKAEEIGFSLSKDLLSERGIQDEILKICDDNDLECVDLLPEFRKNDDQLYYCIDEHMNSKGYELAAEILYDYVYIQG